MNWIALTDYSQINKLVDQSEIFLIFIESVDTKTSLKHLLFIALLITCAIDGTPRIFLIFLLGSLLLKCFAGIMHMASIKYIFYNNLNNKIGYNIYLF